MRKNCYDPECPANKQLASTSKSKTKYKKRRPSCHKDCRSASRTSIKPRKRSKYARSKKRSKERVITSRIIFCKNKKCQASKQYVESSTSVDAPEKICVRSKESVRLCRSRLPCQDTRPRRKVCNCHPHQNVSEKKKEKKPCRLTNYKRRAKLLMPLCICTRTSSLDNFRRDKRPSCPIIARYDECCCRKHRRNRSTTVVAPRRNLEKNSCHKCHCNPAPTPRIQPNIFLRGLASFRRKIQRFKRSPSNPKRNRRRVSRSHPVENCCSRSCLKKRNESSPERRKVKFYK